MEKNQLKLVENNTPTTIPSKKEENSSYSIESKEEYDLVYARESYLSLLEHSRESIELLIELVKESQSPRAFEVLSTLIRSTADITDKIVDLHKSNKQLISKDQSKNISSSETNNSIVNNNLFVGSTEEVQRMLQKVQKEVEEKIINGN